jgi:teichuronic acid biosynthesis glycosyltransferase TuaC
MNRGNMMRIASTTLCYPSPGTPTRGIFVQQRLQAINHLASVRVVAPIPWFAGFRQEEVGDSPQDDPPVWRPKMYYLPKFYKSLDAVFYSRALARGIREAFTDGPPDLIDAHFEWPDSVGAWLVSRRLKIPMICTLRGKLESQAAEVDKRRQIANMLRCANGLISVSTHLAEMAEDIAGMPLDIKIIPNGVDPGVFNGRVDRTAARQACGWDADAAYVVSVGHLQKRKGFDRLVSIWHEVAMTRRKCKLVLVGGPAGEPGFEKDLQNLIRKQRVEDSVMLVGRKSQAEVALMLQAADLFALWTKSEGSCNAINEALACGCPVVTTDVGGNREIIHDPSIGRLVGHDDIREMVSALRLSLLKDWDRAMIAKVGGSRTWQTVASECVSAFHDVMQKVRQRAVLA